MDPGGPVCRRALAVMRHRLISTVLVLSLAPGLAGCAGQDPGCVAAEAIPVLALMIITGNSGPIDFCPRHAATHRTSTGNTSSNTLKIFAEEAKLYRERADKGDAEAQHKLGVMYDAGQGVPQDYAEAAKWYRKAADQGNATAQYNLGYNYEFGHGVPQDDVQAYKWLSLAVAHGDNTAPSAREYLEKQMTPAQIAEAKKLASEWKPVGAGAIAPPTASPAPTTGVSQPIAPASAGPASPHPRIGPV